MILTLQNIAFYLLDKGLLKPEILIEGEWTVRNMSARNLNFATNLEYQHHRHLIKQVRAMDAEKTETLRIEATVYWLANNDPMYSTLKKNLPNYYHFDIMSHTLITELLPDVEDLHAYFSKTRHISTEIAQSIANILASYHGGLKDNLKNSSSFNLFKQHKPWFFSWVKQTWQQETVQGAEKQMLSLIINNKEFVTLIKEVETLWSADALIHGDIKLNNFLINTNYANGQNLDLRLVDWELADIGDPMWDVAAVFNTLLAQWVLEQPPQYSVPQKAFSPIQLSEIQPLIHIFWETYTQKMQLIGETKNEAIKKAVKLLAIKLIHTCFEAIQQHENMPANSARLLQMSLNILRNPEKAITDLLGIPLKTENNLVLNFQPYNPAFQQ
jgi:thiamine kinase-like enzyme